MALPVGRQVVTPSDFLLNLVQVTTFRKVRGRLTFAFFVPRSCSPPSTAWTTSQGLTTGTPARTRGPPTATCAARPCPGSRPTGCPVKVREVFTARRGTWDLTGDALGVQA